MMNSCLSLLRLQHLYNYSDSKEVFVAQGQRILSNSSEMLLCNHDEEADTTIIVHIIDALNKGLSTCLLRALSKGLCTRLLHALKGLSTCLLIDALNKGLSTCLLIDALNKGLSTCLLRALKGCLLIDALNHLCLNKGPSTCLLIDALNKGLSTCPLHAVNTDVT